MSHTKFPRATQAPRKLSRRALLLGTGAAAATAGMGLSIPPAQAERLKTKAHIVIAGSGLGGIAIAHRLQDLLDGVRITIIDAKEVHNYQPGFTLVGIGVWPVRKVIDRNADLQPDGVEWIRDMVAEFDPAANAVVTRGGQRITYDYLVVATGTHQDWAQIEGMDIQAIGNNGLTSIYPSSDAALTTWKTMDAFRQVGGQAVMTMPATPLKCAGAPLKMTFMVRDRLLQSGQLDKSHVEFYSALDNVFSVPVVNDAVLKRWKKLDIGVQMLQTLKSIDIGARRATFADPSGATTEVPYDFIHVVPPMRAVDAVWNSDLAWKTGDLAGWLEVDQRTLQHLRYPNVFGVGDINGTSRGKTAATVKKSAPIVARHLVEVMQGRTPNERFDGYTSCPLIVREGAAWLVEFDYEGRLTPYVPMIEPLQDSYAAWLMKLYMLKPAYMAVLKGRV